MSIKISILLPIRNEEKFISKCLDRILSQTGINMDEVEIIIADGMSSDGTKTVIYQYQKMYPNIYLIENPGRIVSTGLNCAIRQSKGKFIIRIDGHTLIGKNYIKQCIDLLEITGADNVGGRMIPVGINVFGQAVALATSTPFGIGGSKFHYSTKEELVDSVYMGAWPRWVFEKNGLFDEELIRDQDDEFNYRVRANGGKILLSPNILSEYFVRSTPKGLWRQYFQYGLFKVRVLQKHPSQMSLRHFIPLVYVLTLFFLLIFSLFYYWAWPLFASALLVYFIVTLLISIWISLQNNWQYFYLLQICYGVLHIGYGLGFLVGLFRFWNQWGNRYGKVPKL